MARIGDGTLATPAMGAREWGLLFSLAMVWGGSFFFLKVLVSAWPPMTVALGRVGIAAVVLNLWRAFRRDPLPRSPRLWLSFAAIGLLNNVLPFTLIAFGETRITGGLASILNATTPLFAVIVAHCLTANERLTPARVAGVLVGFAGVAVIVGPAALSGLGRDDLLGQAACLTGALSYALAGVYGRRFRNRAAITVATGQITASTFLLLVPVALFDRPWTLPVPGLRVWGALIGIAVLCTVIAYILYFRILAAAGATNLLLVTFLLPGSALLLGWCFLGEAIGPADLAGLALIGVGLWGCSRPAGARRRSPGALSPEHATGGVLGSRPGH